MYAWYYPGQKIETGTHAKHRRVHARQITRLRHVRAVVSIFFGQDSRSTTGKGSTHAQSTFVACYFQLLPDVISTTKQGFSFQ